MAEIVFFPVPMLRLRRSITLAEGLKRAVAAVLRESVRISGDRKEQFASWTKDAQGCDVPELELNLCVIFEAFLRLLASGLGAIILVSATAVVLGGFSTQVRKTDFWYIRAIIIIQTARVVGFISGPAGRFFAQVPPASMRRVIWTRLGRITGFVEVVTMVPVLFAAAPIVAAAACIALPILGLSFVHSYGGSDINTRNGNVKQALIFFYSLVLAQGVLFLVWFMVAVARSEETAKLSHGYFENRNGKELVARYVTQTQDKCIEIGMFGTANKTLVSFAGELLQSEHCDDLVSAVSVLHVLITREERAAGAVEQICSSEQVVGRLVKLLRSSSPIDPETKAYAAEIVAKLACNLRLADIPGAAHSISSLLDPRLMNTAAQTGSSGHLQQPPVANQININTEGGANDKPLIVHGLAILYDLANDLGNCTEMYNTKGLLPKIIAPVSRGLLMMSIGNDPKTVQIVKASLRLLAKLTSGIGESESITNLHSQLSENVTAKNILWIIKNSSDQEMRIVAVEILSRLTLDEEIMAEFIDVRRSLLLYSIHGSLLRISEGRTLNALGIDSANSEVPVTLMVVDGNSREHRAKAAELLAKICASSTDLLSSVSSLLLSTVLKTVVTETANMTELDGRKFLASFLSLAVQIREKLTTPAAFESTVAELLRQNLDFSTKLQEIIEMPNDSKDEVYLVLMKAALKLATRMMVINNNTFIQYFGQEITVNRLRETVNGMGDIERYVVLSGGADEMEPYETLHTLVETAIDLASRGSSNVLTIHTGAST